MKIVNPNDGRCRTVTEIIEASRARIHSAMGRARRGKTIVALTRAILEMQHAKFDLYPRDDRPKVK